MENENDPGSQNTVSSSIDGSGSGCELDPGFELSSLIRLSSRLETLVGGAENHGYSDAEIEVEGIPVGVYRGVLAAASPFFHELFKRNGRDEGNMVIFVKQRYVLAQLVPDRIIGYEAFMVLLSYMYTGKLKPSPPEVSTCVDESCTHEACLPAIRFALELMYASIAFQIDEIISVLERRLLDFVDKVFLEGVFLILRQAIRLKSNRLLSHCVQRVAHFDVDDIIIERDLPHGVISDIRSIRAESNFQEEHNPTRDFLNRKSIRRIYRALDSNDIELVRLLLDESDISMDDAYVLHYAASVCSPKMFDEVLALGDADTNLRTNRGYTVLHVAAWRRDPSILLRVLQHGASVFETTPDGRTAVTIRRRFTRPKDFNEEMRLGKETNMDRLCIEVLEREMFGKLPLGEDVSVPSEDDLYMKLLVLENRVAMTKSLFPVEARLLMHIANVDSTSEFTGLLSAFTVKIIREADLNELPHEQVKRLRERLRALQKAVEASRRYFPNCSEVLDRLLEDDTLGDMLLERGDPEEQRLKRARYKELKADLINGFHKDMDGTNLAESRKARKHIFPRNQKTTLCFSFQQTSDANSSFEQVSSNRDTNSSFERSKIRAIQDLSDRDTNSSFERPGYQLKFRATG